MQGYFITLEGGEGSGKSTMIQKIVDYLTMKNFIVHSFNDPSKDIPECKKIREILLSKESTGLTPRTELLLYLAARDLLDTHKISPALNEGDIVVCDRYSDSTEVYQGYARDYSPTIRRIVKSTKIDLKPNLTFYLDIDPRIGLNRSIGRLSRSKGPDESRFENMDIQFHEKVRDGFMKLAKRQSKRIKIIDASKDIDYTWSQIKKVLNKKMREISSKSNRNFD